MAQRSDNGKDVYGWTGKILRVDLSRPRVWEEPLTDTYMDAYIGGAGINARLLYDHLRTRPETDALSPENALIFGAGPLVGTPFPAASRDDQAESTSGQLAGKIDSDPAASPRHKCVFRYCWHDFMGCISRSG